ncbi:heparan-alpha-glucosaminide N-acetyltransferase domain-containing protein [Ornithinimicrobium cavernae]|uniref:heparan-alpha-glucosaminide N-acetyltransferase domain-containing protein n=1 Tax=Ornithinimicrobium cavernae TaxID=2666047 RepID=UPI000D68B9D1|nr:heparan-alpha-glucosaminide N-acetyltransferase domain-containing protein [Ornithinimicrobium cavernae]
MGRIVGIDLARCLALLGMITAHLVEGGVSGEVSTWAQITSGRSAALFAVLAGVSISLVTRSRPDRTVAGSRLALVARAVLIALIGLVLGVPDSGLAVILTYYGVLFLVALPVITWSAPRLALLAVAWGLLSPVVSLAVRPHLPPSTYEVPGPQSLADPLRLLTELTVTGYYPVLTWATYLFAGLAIGRLDLRSLRVRRWLVLLGGWLAVLALAVERLALRSGSVRDDLLRTYDRWEPVQDWADLDRVFQTGLYGTTPTGSWAWLWVWSPHSGSIVDLAHTVGSSMFLIGLSLLLVSVAGRLGRSVQVLAGAGTMTLTLYVAHVTVVAAGRTDALSGEAPWVLDVRWHLLGVLLVGAVFALARWRGPLEQLVGEVSSSAAQLLR